MTALTTLEGLESGTGIAVVQGNYRSKWTYVDGTMVDERGDPLDLMFFGGLLKNGHLHLANFSPPVIGEWFCSIHHGGIRFWLALGEEQENVTWVGQFDRGVWMGLHQVSRIVDYGTRREPDWLTEQTKPLLLAMSTQLLNQRTTVDRADRVRREMRGLVNDMQVVQSYVGSLNTRLERVREM